MLSFTKDQMVLIYNDQKIGLENVHIGGDVCDDISNCPPDHFAMDEDIEEIFLRQAVMKKIEGEVELQRIEEESVPCLKM